MTVFELLFAWKLKVLKWTFYAFVIVAILIAIALKSISFSFLYPFIENSLKVASGWDVTLSGDAHLSWVKGPGFDIENVVTYYPVQANITGLEIPLHKLAQLWATNTYNISFDMTADSLEIDNFLLEDVKLKSDVRDYGDLSLHLTADSGSLNTGRGNPEISSILNDVLPIGDGSDELKCLSAPFTIDNNFARTENTVMETGTAYLVWDGQADFKSETLDFKIRPEPKKLEKGVPATPVYITGSFSDPQFKVLPQDVFARLGMAIRGIKKNSDAKVECDEKIL